jgi:lipoyl synthase
MDDLRAVGVDIVTFGQYLRPTCQSPAGAALRDARSSLQLLPRMGPGSADFMEVVSGALVRSSYRAEQVLQKNNVGLS